MNLKRRRYQGPTAEALFEWAERWTQRAAARGHGTDYPTIRQAARRFRCRQRAIDELLDGYHEIPNGYLGKGVGWQVGGLGGGTAEIEKVGDYIVEAYRVSDTPVLDDAAAVIERISSRLAKPNVSLYPLTLREWSLVMGVINGRKS